MQFKEYFSLMSALSKSSFIERISDLRLLLSVLRCTKTTVGYDFNGCVAFGKYENIR